MLNFYSFTLYIVSLLVLGLSLRIKFQISIFVAVACSPLLIIATGIFAQLINGSTNNFFEPGRIWSMVWVLQVFGCLLFLIFKRNIVLGEVSRKEFVGVLLIAIFSASIWFVATNFFQTPPKDNDVLIHLFTTQWLSTDAHKLSCLLPRDAISNMGLRFVPCASHILSLSITPWSPVDAIYRINLVYGITAFLIPFAAASFTTLSRIPKIDPRILSLVSISFLGFPYALNGLMPFSLGLALITPSLILLQEADRAFSRTLLALFLGIVLFTVHPIAVLFFLLASVVIERNWLISHWRQVAALGSLGIALFFVGFSRISLIQSLLDGISAGNSSRVLTSSDFFTRFFLGNEWTRAQPLMVGFFVWGLLLILRFGTSSSRGFVSITSVLYILWLLMPYEIPFVKILAYLFYGDWYRVLAVLIIFLWFPVSIAASKLIKQTKQSGNLNFKFLVLTMVLLTFISVGTGFRIVQQAWSRTGALSSDAIDSMSKLKFEEKLIALNNPVDGSAWAYGLSGIALVAATDRGVDQQYGKMLENLSDARLREYVCVVQRELEFNAVLLVGHSLQLKDDISSVIEKKLWSDEQLALFTLSQSFLDDCQTIPECVQFSAAPEWFTAIASERFRGDRNWDCSAPSQ